jgi:hypothetical protein
MKKYPLILITLLIAACGSDDVDKAGNDPDWLKIEIPNAREAFAAVGNIDDTLIVTTWIKAYYTTDHGKTWVESYDFQGPVAGLLEKGDTIISLHGTLFALDGYKYASSGLRYTVDFGNTWERMYRPDLKQRIGVVRSSSDTEYYLKENLTPIEPGSNTFTVNPTDIMKKSVDGAIEQIQFPYKHNILNLYIDSEDRLYIVASGGIYQEETNGFLCCADDMSAIVYVSKRANP